MGVLTGCKPRKEVLKGDLQDAIFAADFGDLVAGRAPVVYGEAKTFFQNTHPAKQLRKVVEVVFGRLADAKETGATLRLSTGFGGGKTHTLMALWHLAHYVGDPATGTDLLPAAGRPKSVKCVGVDGSKAGVPTFARHGKIEARSLWGELAYQLGGEQAWKAIKDADTPEAQPNEHELEKLMPKGPVLILLDELVVYTAGLSEQGQGNVLGFLKKLASIVGKRPQAVLVVTDPAGQVAYARQASQLGKALDAERKLDEVLARQMSDFNPVEGEAAQVIVRRLLEHVDPAAAQAASATYHALYERVLQEMPATLPARVGGAEYARRVVQCYPFHPRLIDTATDRLGAMQDFQKSRGVLRLFARILRDVWESGEDVELISAGELDWSSPRIQADLLQRLNRDDFRAAVSADVDTHAGELDGDRSRAIHQRAASAILLESLPLQPSSGLEPPELTLAILRPDEAGPEPVEAAQRLAGVCWHLYAMSGGAGWQFRYEANIIKQIEERKSQIPLEDARSRVLGEVQGYFSGPTFKLRAWPTGPRQVPDVAELQLALCEDERIAKVVCAHCDDSDPQALMPRAFRNAIVGVTATAATLGAAIDRAQRLMAAEAIERDARTGEAGRLVRDQLQRVKPELHRQFRIQTCRAFDRVVLASGQVYALEEQYQVPDEQILQQPQGQAALRRFLDGKGLIYKPGDALDVDRFVKDVLPGATPLPDSPAAYSARAVHERFLQASGLRLIPDGGIVRQTILRSVAGRQVVVRLPDGRAYDDTGVVEGPSGQRHRVAGASLTTLPLDDSVWITRSDSTVAVEWLKEDPAGYGPVPAPKPPEPATKVTAISWDKVVEHARTRPLLELHLVAAKPAVAAGLLALAQPLGADGLALTVTVGGSLKDGGTANFAVYDVKPTHAIRPLQVAQTLFNALAEGSTYEADLTLGFGVTGRSGLESQLGTLAEEAPDGVAPKATFGKPGEGQP